GRHRLGERREVEHGGAADAGREHRGPAAADDRPRAREDARGGGLLQECLEAPPSAHAGPTAGSRNSSRPAPPSRRTRVPSGTGWFTAPWPTGRPATHGSPASAASSARTSALA